MGGCPYEGCHKRFWGGGGGIFYGVSIWRVTRRGREVPMGWGLRGSLLWEYLGGGGVSMGCNRCGGASVWGHHSEGGVPPILTVPPPSP